jgi:hypothetical protein
MKSNSRTRIPNCSALVRATLCAALGTLLLTGEARAFSLLGPFADWMQTSNYYRLPDDIGGPMDLGEEYRWNTPIVTYAFDPSFVNYFGAKGVKQVEEAIRLLNRVPAASRIVLSNYATDTEQLNIQAAEQNLIDLRSTTLGLLLEQMGLTLPIRNIYRIRTWDPEFFSLFPDEASWPPETFPTYLIRRNFDPMTYAPTSSVNGRLYMGLIMQFPAPPYWSATTNVAEVALVPVDPLPPNSFAVTEAAPAGFGHALDYGQRFTALTRDDAGGIKYVLRADHVHYENLLPDVNVSGPNGAWRPGIERLHFVRHPFLKRLSQYPPVKIRFIANYVTDGVVNRQSAVRTVAQPDFLFCAADLGDGASHTPLVTRTGTSNWVNNAALNGNPDAAGPGVIQPRIRIVFHKLGANISTDEASTNVNTWITAWGSFKSATNPPIVHPVAPRDAGQFTLRLRFWSLEDPSVLLQNETWHLPIPVGGQALLQISTNQIDWTTVGAASNTGAVVEWSHHGTQDPPKFFRAIPAPTGLTIQEQLILIEAQRISSEQFPGGPVLPLTPISSGTLGGSTSVEIISASRRYATEPQDPIATLIPFGPPGIVGPTLIPRTAGQ